MNITKSERPFKVLGIQQIAIGGPDKARLQTLWVDLFGLEVTGTFRRGEIRAIPLSDVLAKYQASSRE